MFVRASKHGSRALATGLLTYSCPSLRDAARQLREIGENPAFQFRHNPRMTQRDLGLILMRQLADGLALPVWLADERGDLLFFNESAERLLGQRFDDVGTLSLDDARRLLSFRDADGNALPIDQTPLLVALRERRPVHRRVWIISFDGGDHEIEVTAFPLVGGGGHLIGGVAMFWERKKAAPVPDAT